MSMSAHQRVRRVMEEKRKAKLQQIHPDISGADTQPNPNSSGAAPQPDINKMSITELKDYAKANGINISGLTKKDDIKARIMEAKNTNTEEKPPAGNDPGSDGVPTSDGRPEGGSPAVEGIDGNGDDRGTA